MMEFHGSHLKPLREGSSRSRGLNRRPEAARSGFGLIRATA
jgi:hypothetical protein